MPKVVFSKELTLKPYDPAIHAPVLGLTNPKSGPKMGAPILEVCARSEHYKDRFFDIVEVFKGTFKKSEMWQNFRKLLWEAKDLSKEKNNADFRPRLFIGGGDGTASFALTVFFKTIAPDPDNGFNDTGNGFAWTDEELKSYFPALVQMPLGTGNDLGRALGWGHHYPGWTTSPCCQVGCHDKHLVNWIDNALRVSTPYVNYDVWGLMPPPGQEQTNVKVCQLAKVSKVDGKKQVTMRIADPVAPFLVFLYCSFGFIAQVVSRFEPHRKSSQIANKIMMGKAVAEIVLGFRAKQLRSGLEGFSFCNLPDTPLEKNGTDRWFPPRDTRKAKQYKDLGFMNANSFVGGQIGGSDRAGCCTRWMLCGKGRKKVDPTDGRADFFRQRLIPTLAKTGNCIQTDKKDGGTIKYKGDKGQGQFFQFDGEGRFAFHPDGEEWRLDVKHVLVVPMVVAGSYFRRSGQPPQGNFEIPGTA
jgi:hypothetical protein